jgi:hypothetical protein
MKSATVTRVNGKGELTGDADLIVWRQAGCAWVKLGLLRVCVNPDIWASMVAPADGEFDDLVLRQAAEVLRRRFGRLTAGDLINALGKAADTIDEQRK